MTLFEQWYKDEYGVHPKDVVKNTPADYQLQASLKAWEAGQESGYDAGYDAGKMFMRSLRK